MSANSQEKRRSHPYTLFLLLASLVSTGCGEEQAPPDLTIRLQQVASPAVRPLSETHAAPRSILLTLSGPGGSRVEEFAHDKRKARLGDMQPGWWSARGDGLREDGSIGWVSPLVQFEVRSGEPTNVKIEFEPLD